jgi:hypothetical protein
MKFCILIDYTTDYILIYFHNFLKLEILIFNYFLNGRRAKSIFREKPSTRRK